MLPNDISAILFFEIEVHVYKIKKLKKYRVRFASFMLPNNESFGW